MTLSSTSCAPFGFHGFGARHSDEPASPPAVLGQPEPQEAIHEQLALSQEPRAEKSAQPLPATSLTPASATEVLNDPALAWRSADPPALPKPQPTEPRVEPEDRAPPPRRIDEGEPITAHLDGIDIRRAIEMVTRDTGLNVIISPNVAGATGAVTANLRGMSPHAALKALLQASGLVAVQENGVLYIYTPEERDRLEQRLPVRIYRLNYVRALDVERIIHPLVSPVGVITMSPPSAVGIQQLQPTTGTTGGIAATSAIAASTASVGAAGGGPGVGGIIGGAAANTTGGDSLAGGEVLVVQDRESVLVAIDQIVHELDVQPVQVLIEAVILSVTLDKNREMGVNFAVLDNARNALTVVGNGNTLNATAGFTPSVVVDAGGKVAGNAGAGFAANESGLKFGFVGGNVTGFIRAIENLGKTEVLAAPRLLVLNKQRAELQLGDRLGYQTIVQNFTSTIQQIEFLDVGTLLRVRPFVSSDGMIRMEIHPERSSGQVVNNIPQTNTSQVTTNVMVPDGATLVIGGLMEKVEDSRQFGIPFLSRLPWIGVLFRDRVQNLTKRELVVLLTPRIWNRAALAPHSPTPLSCPVPALREAPLMQAGYRSSAPAAPAPPSGPVVLGSPAALPSKRE